MDRAVIGKLLMQYLQAVEDSPVLWDRHLRIARLLHARWLGGESVVALKAALQVEWQMHMEEKATWTDSETFAAFRVFCDLCGEVGPFPFPMQITQR